MKGEIVQSQGGITLVGGAPVSPALFRMAIQRAPRIVAADGGADRCLAHGAEPEAVIGDMDSVSPRARAILGAARFHSIAEQDSTDFDKVLRSVRAPFTIGVGFLGARVDHTLAVFNVLARRREICVLLGAQDVVFQAPVGKRVTLQMRAGDRFSLFPMMPVHGVTEGLEWPIDGLELSPGGQTSTSNRVTAGPVCVQAAGPGLLVIVSRGRLDQVLAGLGVGSLGVGAP